VRNFVCPEDNCLSPPSADDNIIIIIVSIIGRENCYNTTHAIAVSYTAVGIIYYYCKRCTIYHIPAYLRIRDAIWDRELCHMSCCVLFIVFWLAVVIRWYHSHYSYDLPEKNLTYWAVFYFIGHDTTDGVGQGRPCEEGKSWNVLFLLIYINTFC